jgi:hypothetical protein
MELLQKTAGHTASAEKFCILKFLNSYKLQKLLSLSLSLSHTHTQIEREKKGTINDHYCQERQTWSGPHFIF